MRTLLTALLVTLTFLAGCAEDPAPAEPEGEDAMFDELDVSDDTGGIRGLVLDPTIVPIEGARIDLIGQDMEAMSDAEGAFIFEQLEPGTYIMEVSRLGYKQGQQSAQVVAGDTRPEIVKVVLQPDPESLPQADTQNWDGYLACGAGATIVSFNPCANAGSENTHNFTVDSTPDWVQVEMIWKGTNALGDSLSIGIYDPDTIASDFVGADCSSPCVFRVNGTTMEEHLGAGFSEYTVRVFPGTGEEGDNPSVVIEQSFSVYATAFYRLDPDEDWMFVVDGAYEVPR